MILKILNEVFLKLPLFEKDHVKRVEHRDVFNIVFICQGKEGGNLSYI